MEIKSYRTQVEGVDMHYLRAGSGSPLLLLHGLLGGSFCWRLNIAPLAETHTVIAVDLPGFGLSDAPRMLDCGMEGQAQRLTALLKQLKIESVDVVGSSWGGAVAMMLAARTRAVRSLVLAAPVNPWARYGARRIRFLAGRTGGTLLRAAMPFTRPWHHIVLERLYGDVARVPEGTVPGYSAILMRKGRVHSILNTLRSWEKDLLALSQAIGQVRAPSLLIWGTKDGAVNLSSSEALMRALPGCERALLPGVGHLPFEEAPEEFNRLVLDFLDRAFQPRA